MKPAASALERVAWALLCALVFSLPIEKAVELPGVGTIARGIGLCAFAAGVAVVARRWTLRPPNLAMFFAGAFVLWSGLTWFWSLAPEATAARFVTLVQLGGMLWLIWELCRTAAIDRWLFQAYLGGAVVSSALTMMRAARDQQTYYRRFATPGFDPNDLGLTLVLALPLALYLAATARGSAAWLYRLAAAPVIAAILLTASRTALIGACLAFLFAALTWRGSRPAQRAGSLALAAFLVSGALWMAPGASRERLATLPTELTSGNLHGRTRIWKTGLKAYKAHWFTGVGAAAYPEAVRPWLGVPGIPGHQYTAHNTFLSITVETGLPGVFFFGGLLVLLALFVWMLAPAERALWVTMLVVWAAGVSTLTWEHRKPTWLIFALIMTAWARAWRRERQT